MSLKISLSGELKQVELEYENLQKHCFLSDKQRLDAKKHNSLVQHQATEQGRPEYSRQWQSSSTRSYDWNQDKSFRFNYGSRRDPNFKHSSLSSERSNPASRPPARDRLSFRREEDSVTNKEPQSRNNNCTPRSEWRPITRIPQSGTIPKPMYSLGSHTPSPRPPREGDVNHRSASPASKQKSGEERVPLLQDGALNTESGRLQEVPIQQLEEVLPLPQSGGSNLPSSSRNPVRTCGEFDPTQDRSAIRTLSEDRVHVSLILGPLFPDDEDDLQGLGPKTGQELASSSALKPPLANKRGPRSPP
ncbi:hypothetical protein Bca52824_080903 [Brassica carinata]|uniref:Uncharacterized protein n=1 Tax=Brassica carinata TaxID=52824 RepID=A0A8X7PHF5_BRACI|nr:hypothetical protein Bca52824_080903 [Brassica carinata]